MAKNWTILYKEDYTTKVWKKMVKDLELPDDTVEITATTLSYVTKRARIETEGKKNVNSSRT